MTTGEEEEDLSGLGTAEMFDEEDELSGLAGEEELDDVVDDARRIAEQNEDLARGLRDGAVLDQKINDAFGPPPTPPGPADGGSAAVGGKSTDDGASTYDAVRNVFNVIDAAIVATDGGEPEPQETRVVVQQEPVIRALPATVVQPGEEEDDGSSSDAETGTAIVVGLVYGTLLGGLIGVAIGLKLKRRAS